MPKNISYHRAFFAPAVLSAALLSSGTIARTQTPVAAPQLSRQVAALPAATSEQKLKKAVLQWAINEALWAEQTGRAERAAELRNDVAIGLASPIGKREAAPPNLLPPIPQFDQNPYARSAMAQVNALIAAGISTDPKAMMNEPGGVADFNNKIGPQALVLTEAFCHEQSPRRGDPAVLPLMFHLWETLYRTHLPGSKLLGDFGHTDNMAQMYLMLKTVYPSLLLPSCKKEWEVSLRANVDAVMKEKSAVFLAGKPGTAYPNADVRCINTLVYSALALDNTEYRKVADAGEKLMTTAIYPDGGWAYIGQQNENYTYHAINIAATARLWQLTQNPVARQNVEASRRYFSLSIEPPGVAEYSMSPSWKHYWNQIKAPESAAILAGVLGTPDDFRVSQQEAAKGDLILASFYRNDIKPVPAPDNYFVYDRNIQGPRGRFGLFSFSGTSRPMPNENRGKSTFVGCMALFPPDKLPPGVSPGYPLDIALDVAGVEVLSKPSSPTTPPVALSQEETNAATVARNVAGLTSTYRVAPYKAPAIDWTGQQAWLYTTERMVGLVSVTSRKAQNGYGVNGALRFFGPQVKNVPARKFETLAPNTLQLGGLITTIHEQTFGKIAQEYPEGRLTGGVLRLLDPQAVDEKETALIHHTAGETHFYLAEIRPAWSKPADTVTRIKTNDGLIGMEVTEGGKHFLLVHNPTTGPLIYHAALPWTNGTIKLHRSGEPFRPAWIGANGKEELTDGPQTVTPVQGVTTVAVPAGTHVILTN